MPELNREMEYLAPQNLKKGDVIGIVSTARKISKLELESAVQLIKMQGFGVLFGTNLFKEDHQFSGTDQERVDDLHEMFLNPKVKAVLMARGGYGTVRILPLVNPQILHNNPKWLIGYSDVTVLHSYFHQKLQMQTLHASMPVNFSAYESSDLAIRSLFDALEGKQIYYEIPASDLNSCGEVSGVLVGGNLSILYSLRGTFADIDTDGKILFIEDLDEYIYHIDRIMMNLKLGGKLDHLKALVVGGMSDMNDNTIPFGKSAKTIIKESVQEFDYPVLFDFPAGHIHDNYALPLGCQVQLIVEPSGGILKSLK